MADSRFNSGPDLNRKTEMNYKLLILSVTALIAKSFQDEVDGSRSSHHSLERNRFLQEPALYASRHYYPHLGDVARSLDRLSGGDVLRSLDSISGSEVLRYPEDQEEWNIQNPRNLDKLNGGEVLKSPKRSLDTLSGMSFGESKRFDRTNGGTGQSKRELDEIDNVGFNRFSKRGYNKRNMDEIDRTGFEGFVKRGLDAYLRSGSYAKHFTEQKRGMQALNALDNRSS